MAIFVLVLGLILALIGYSAIPAQAALGITLSPPSGAPGISVTISGTDFTANSTITSITFDSTAVTPSPAPPIGGDGRFSASITIPAAPAGSHTVTATDGGTPPKSASATFTVTPGLSLSPTSGPQGTSVTVTGSGFGASETGIVVTYDGTAVTTGTPANAQGGWTATFTVPTSASGSHNVGAYGNITQAGSVTPKLFTLSPGLSLSRTSGTAGSSVTVTGSGFGAGETGITVTYDGTAVTPGTSANATGGWSATFTVPTSASGAHTIDAYGSTTLAASVPDASFTVGAGITLSRTTGAPGSSVTVTGSGFGANETGITVTYDGTAVTTGTPANAQGGWTATFTVPISASGPHTIDAYGSTTQPASVPDISFTVGAGITLSRTSGAPGSSVTVTGSGFSAGETGITVTYDGNPVTSGISANAQGGWTATLTVPTSASGAHTIKAYGSTTQPGSVLDAVFLIGGGMSLSRTSGAVGSSVTVTGSGFGAGETGITVTYDGVPVAMGISATPQGGWSTSFKVPPSAFGPHAIRAYGSTTQPGSVGDLGFGIIPGISISPASGYVGTTIEIAGSGFAANSSLRFTYDDMEIPAGGLTSDASGSFSKSFSAPKSKGGNHTIRVVDGERNDSRAIFSMDSTPPSIPSLLSPDDGARFGILGGATPALKWSNVTDPSGVTFTLEVDTSPDFTSPILEKTDISVSSYTLREPEALPDGRYYWRVKAIDGASNESAWSQPRALISGLMPLWALIMITVVAIGVIGVIVFFLMGRLAGRRREAIPVPEAGPPLVIPGQWRELEPEEPPRARLLPWRRALPQPSRTAKAVSPEEQARLKAIADFAQALPLVEPGYDIGWLIDLIESSMGIEVSPQAHEQLLQGELAVRYEPSWTRHPLYLELTGLLEGQPVLQELNAFVDTVDRCVSEAVLLLREIYRDSVTEASLDSPAKGSLAFVSAVYSDAMSWFRGKSLREPSERDYSIKPAGPEEQGGAIWLHSEATTSFAGPLVPAQDDNEALRLRALHLRLRRTYRNNDKARQLVSMMARLEVQRSRLLNVFSQFGRFTGVV